MYRRWKQQVEYLGPGDPSLPTGIGGYWFGWTRLGLSSVLAMHTAFYSYSYWIDLQVPLHTLVEQSSDVLLHRYLELRFHLLVDLLNIVFTQLHHQ
jgi:hypothetical protein